MNLAVGWKLTGAAPWSALPPPRHVFLHPPQQAEDGVSGGQPAVTQVLREIKSQVNET